MSSFKSTAPTVSYTLSLHDALPISVAAGGAGVGSADRDRAGYSAGVCEGDLPAAGGRGYGLVVRRPGDFVAGFGDLGDRKSTRLNSSHLGISYAVFCLKTKRRASAG